MNHRGKPKKLKTRNTKSYSDIMKASGPAKPFAARRQANWGKASISGGLAGAVPELFVFNCAGGPDEQIVKSYLESCELVINNVKRMSPVDAFKHSFRITVATFEDYDKLLSGGILPRFVGVKKFVYGRRKVEGDQWARKLSVGNHSSSSASQGSSDHTITNIIGDGKVDNTGSTVSNDPISAPKSTTNGGP